MCACDAVVPQKSFLFILRGLIILLKRVDGSMLLFDKQPFFILFLCMQILIWLKERKIMPYVRDQFYRFPSSLSISLSRFYFQRMCFAFRRLNAELLSELKV